YAYQYRDHLGNIRLSYMDINGDNLVDGTGSTSYNDEILEENNYYPFGLKHQGYNDIPTSFANTALKWKYNNTEYEKALGLNLYEMPLRSYDPAIARWTTIDPVTHHSQSTYNGYDNNPVYWADPSGADVVDGAFSTTYTGIDAQNLFRQLQSQNGASNSNSGGNSDSSETGNGSNSNNTNGSTNDCDDCKKCPETCDNNKLSLNLGDISAGIAYGGYISGITLDEVPKLTKYDFWLRSYNPSTGISTFNSIPGEIFETGTKEALNALKVLRLTSKGLSYLGNAAGYYTAYTELVNRNYTSAAIETWGATAGVLTGIEYGGWAGAAWAVGWESGRVFTNYSEAYNRKAFGIYSDIYIKRALSYKWNIELNTTQMNLAISRKLY
ncbi:RHS repeat-associated core domain-containing protein, partial [Flavisericum labens]|uniref:RHS repeat-associated core domain-containing protein n=1 Tax=Flavisericum labens TaxID=3377112 RepID=UPI00387A9BD9